MLCFEQSSYVDLAYDMLTTSRNIFLICNCKLEAYRNGDVRIFGAVDLARYTFFSPQPCDNIYQLRQSKTVSHQGRDSSLQFFFQLPQYPLSATRSHQRAYFLVLGRTP